MATEQREPVATADQVADGPAVPDIRASASSETTRNLCAATHVDEGFCQHAIAAVLDEPLRAVAPSYGVDLSAVIRHALWARRRRRVRDMILTILALGLAGVVIAGVLARRSALEETDAAARAVAGITLPVLAMLLAAWLTVAVERCLIRLRVVPALAGEDVDAASVAPPVARRFEQPLRDIQRSQRGNVIVFSGFDPFVGSGALLHRWSFAVDATKGVQDAEGDRRRKPEQFTAVDLHEHMARSVAALGLPGLRVEHRFLVDGRDVCDTSLLPDPQRRPESQVGEATIRWALGDAESTGRAYLAVQAIGWNGQLVITMFFRAVRLEGSIFLEGNTFALMPLKDRYLRTGRPRTTTVADAALSELRTSAAETIPALIEAPFRLATSLRRAARSRSERKSLRRLIAAGQVVDYGALTSLREDATGDHFNRYFLMLDQDMYVKVAQERLLRSVSEFLRARGVDTEEFAVQQTVINRNQTINVSSSGSGNVAVASGDDASVHQAPASAASGR